MIGDSYDYVYVGVSSLSFAARLLLLGVCGSVVVETLWYKSKGVGFETR
jgi:hypothetical protein